MEHKRDADAAGLAWPGSNTRTQSTSLPSDASSSAVSLNPPPQGNPMSPPTLGSSSAENTSLTTSGMYPAGPQPSTPFPSTEHRHSPSLHQGRFSERLVHQIHFKIFTHSNNTQELFVMEIPTTGISRTRDPEHFFYAMSGQWEWSQRTADYWRHYFGVPMRHGTNPFRHGTGHRPDTAADRCCLAWPHSCMNVCRQPWHLGNLQINGEWCSE